MVKNGPNSALAATAGARDVNGTTFPDTVTLTRDGPELVINGASTAELKGEAIRLGMQTLRMAGLAKLKAGMTSIEEVVGNTAPDTMR